MTITPAQVNAWRARAQWLLRALGLLLIVGGLYLVLKRIVFAAVTGDLRMAFQVWQDVGENHSFSRGTAMLLVGAALAVFNGRLSRWVITLPPNTCPRCGHRRTSGAGARCTECGLEGVNVD